MGKNKSIVSTWKDNSQIREDSHADEIYCTIYEDTEAAKANPCKLANDLGKGCSCLDVGCVDSSRRSGGFPGLSNGLSTWIFCPSL
jgi:hypothetical protein